MSHTCLVYLVPSLVVSESNEFGSIHLSVCLLIMPSIPSCVHLVSDVHRLSAERPSSVVSVTLNGTR